MALNKVVKILLYHDLVLYSGLGLVAPILAVFISGNIKGGNVEVAGIAIGIYWVLKSIVQVTVGVYLDRRKGEEDDYYFLVGGSLLAGLSSFAFVFATLPVHVYLIQIIYTFGMAVATPGWFGIFGRHINKERGAQSWSIDSSAVGIGDGIAGIIGGIVANRFGFSPLFIAMGILGIVSAILCIFIRNDLNFPPSKAGASRRMAGRKRRYPERKLEGDSYLTKHEE